MGKLQAFLAANYFPRLAKYPAEKYHKLIHQTLHQCNKIVHKHRQCTRFKGNLHTQYWKHNLNFLHQIFLLACIQQYQGTIYKVATILVGVLN